MRCIIFLLTILTVVFSCKSDVLQEGYVKVEGGKIWYSMKGKTGKTPLLILHGGPGSNSCNMMAGYSKLEKERPVIFFDQLGSGRSDRTGDTTYWKVEKFVKQVDAIRKELDLNEVIILGHSWGGALLAEYMVTGNPEGVKACIFSSPLISTPMWIEDAKILLEALPLNIRDTINKYERLEIYDAPSYISATDSFYSRHLSRENWPYKKVLECDGSKGFYTEIYNYMWGPTEFTANGTLKDFDRSQDLSKIQVPILFLSGEYDEARPETMKKFKELSKNAQVAVIQNAAHMTMMDNPEQLAKEITSFLSSVED